MVTLWGLRKRSQWGAAFCFDISELVEVAVVKTIGSRPGLDRGQQIVRIGIACGQDSIGINPCRGCCHTVHTVIGVVCPGSIRILGILHPIQHIGVGIVSVGSGISCRICRLVQSVTTIVVRSRGCDAVSYRYGSIVSVGVVIESIDYPCFGGSCLYIVVIVVGVSRYTVIRQFHAYHIVGAVVGVCGFATLGIYYLFQLSFLLSVLMVSITGTKPLLEELDAVKVDSIDVIVVGQLYSNGTVGFCGDHRRGAVLPVDITVRVRVEPGNKGALRAVGVVECAAGWLVNQSPSRHCCRYNSNFQAMELRLSITQNF